MNTPGQNQQPKAHPSLAETILCEKCNCERFSLVFLLKKLNSIVSPTGKTQVVPVQSFQCIKCGNINKELDPSAPDM